MGSQICGSCFQPVGYGPCPYCGYDPAENRKKYPLALMPGSILNGRFVLGKVLGQGGFGITYVAQNVKTGERVAIKEFFPETLATRYGSLSVVPYSGEREENFRYGMKTFLAEAQTMAQFMGNSGIVCVHSYFEENGTAYFAMEYVDGISLQAYLIRRGRLGWEETKRLLFPVMDALSVVHSKGIIHRDIAPDNIFIKKDGQMKLLDFGAARYSLGDKSRSLDVVLKHGYAPMEQYTRHGRQGPFTDVYAMAATMYHCLTGIVPPDSVERRDLDEIRLPSALGSDIPGYAQNALMKALSVQAQERYQTMADFQNGLKMHFRPQPQPQPRPQPQPQPRPQPQPQPRPQPQPQPRPQPQPQAQASPPKKKSHWLRNTVIAAIVLSLWGNFEEDSSKPRPSSPESGTYVATQGAESAATDQYSSYNYVGGYWGDPVVRSNGTYGFFAFNEPLYGCRGFTLEFDIVEVTQGSFEGSYWFEANVRTTDGKIHGVASFQATDMHAVVNVTLDYPMDVEGVFVTCGKAERFEYSHTLMVRDVK